MELMGYPRRVQCAASAQMSKVLDSLKRQQAVDWQTAPRNCEQSLKTALEGCRSLAHFKIAISAAVERNSPLEKGRMILRLVARTMDGNRVFTCAHSVPVPQEPLRGRKRNFR